MTNDATSTACAAIATPRCARLRRVLINDTFAAVVRWTALVHTSETARFRGTHDQQGGTMLTRKSWLATTLATVVLCSAGVAQARYEEQDYARPGFYLGAGGVFAVELFDDHIDTDSGNGFHVRGGYRFHPNFGLEARYENYLRLETDPGPGHYEGWSATLNGKAYFLTGRWQPYALVGVGYLDMSYPGPNRASGAKPGDDVAMRFGLGMDANLTEHIAMGPEVAFMLPFSDVEDFQMIDVAVGLQFKF
jgi:OmpA-OmpF porin, OOP family